MPLDSNNVDELPRNRKFTDGSLDPESKNFIGGENNAEGNMSEEAKNGMNTCWELDELFKSPFNKSFIPTPENILNYIKHMMPRCKWPNGSAIATRKYPNGALFVSMFENGSGLIFYPHGGLAIAISAPRPRQRVLVIRDPLDGFFFMDKAVLAEFNTVGFGSVFDKNGAVHTQYNDIGGLHMSKREDQKSLRWLWSEGGIRLIVKLNKYINIHISKLDKIGVAFNGNKRGLHINVGEGRKVSALRVDDKPEELIGSKGKVKLRNPDETDGVDFE